VFSCTIRANRSRIGEHASSSWGPEKQSTQIKEQRASKLTLGAKEASLQDHARGLRGEPWLKGDQCKQSREAGRGKSKQNKGRRPSIKAEFEAGLDIESR
jgi:hypothetical protein